jgi:hypothetical protein
MLDNLERIYWSSNFYRRVVEFYCRALGFYCRVFSIIFKKGVLLSLDCWSSTDAYKIFFKLGFYSIVGSSVSNPSLLTAVDFVMSVQLILSCLTCIMKHGETNCCYCKLYTYFSVIPNTELNFVCVSLSSPSFLIFVYYIHFFKF